MHILVVAEPQDQEEDTVIEGVRASTLSFPSKVGNYHL